VAGELLLSPIENEPQNQQDKNDDQDDPEDTADRKEHSERCKHSRLLVGVSVRSLLVGLRNGKLSRAVVVRLLGRGKARERVLAGLTEGQNSWPGPLVSTWCLWG